jgi:hypothetical protein
MGSFAAQVFNLNKVSLLIFISQIEMLVLWTRTLCLVLILEMAFYFVI